MVNPRYMAVISREREAREGPRPPRRAMINWKIVALAAGGAAFLYYFLSSDPPRQFALAAPAQAPGPQADEAGKSS